MSFGDFDRRVPTAILRPGGDCAGSALLASPRSSPLPLPQGLASGPQRSVHLTHQEQEERLREGPVPVLGSNLAAVGLVSSLLAPEPCAPTGPRYPQTP